jgi:hypothetical protein
MAERKPKLPPEVRAELPTLPPASGVIGLEPLDEYVVLVPLVGKQERGALKLDAQSALVLEQADGLTPLRAIVQRLPMSRHEVLTVAAELCARGLATTSPLTVTPEPIPVAPAVTTSEIRFRKPEE